MAKRAAESLLFAALVAQFLFFLVPWVPFSTELGGLEDISVDVAFALAAPHFFLSHVQYGPEAIFTYGPMMFLAGEPMGKELLGNWVVIFRFALSAITAVAMIKMIRSSCNSTTARALAIASAALICLLWSSGLSDWLWLAAPMILVVERKPSERGQTWLLLAIIVAGLWGVASLVKFTIAIVAGWSFFILAISDLSQRKWPIPSIIFVASFLLSWTMIAEQHLETLPTWVFLSLDLSSGYSDAMAKGFYVPYDWPTVLRFYLAEFALLLAISWTAPKLTTIYFVVLTFLGIKHTFGGNQIEQECIGLLFTALCVTMLAGRSPVRRPVTLCATITIAVISAGTILFNAEYVVRAFAKTGEVSAGKLAAITTALSDPSTKNGWETYKAAVRTAADLPLDLKGTTDIYPSKTAIPLSYPALTYQPRPAFLSLNAHTAKLAKLNRDFLSSDRAPDNILFEILADGHNVNRRLPATEDGMSWPDIFAKYALSSEKNDLLILKRKTKPPDVRFGQLMSGSRSLNEVIDVPARPLVWAQIDVRKSLAGKLIDLLYKSPRIFIDLKTDGGQTLSHELVPELGRAGFLLSPYVGTTANFRDTMMGDPEPRQTVKSFFIRQENGPRWMINPAINITLSELYFSGEMETSPVRKIADRSRSPYEISRNAKDCLLPPDLFRLKEEAEDAVQMHAPCQTFVTVPPGSKTAVVRFGLRDSSYLTSGGHTGGATFQVSSQTGPDTSFKPLWFTELDTFAIPGDRKMHTVTLPIEDASMLKLETGVGSDGSPIYDHTYWGRIDFLP